MFFLHALGWTWLAPWTEEKKLRAESPKKFSSRESGPTKKLFEWRVLTRKKNFEPRALPTKNKNFRVESPSPKKIFEPRARPDKKQKFSRGES